MIRPKLVVVGNGMAGVRTIEEVLRLAPDRYEITVFGAEPHPNYNRILLSPVLSGERSLDEIILNDFAWYREHGVHLSPGRSVVAIDRQANRVLDDTGCATAYDKLLLATGSLPIILPVPGRDLEGVVAYRDIADTKAMIDASQRYRDAVVIGGGLLGLEAACGLVGRGMRVSVVHLAPWLMERQLDAPAAELLKESLEKRGISIWLGTQTHSLLADPTGRVAAVLTGDGDEIAAQLVVMAVGIRPNTALAESAGLHCERGIVVDDTLKTADARIYAVGECANHRGRTYGLVAPLFEQAQVCADHLAGPGNLRYPGSVLSTKLKVTGIDVFSAGDFQGDEKAEQIVLTDLNAGVYQKLVIRQGKLVGACLYGDTEQSPWYLDLMRRACDIASIRDELMFGVPEAEVAGDGPRLAADIGRETV